MIMGMKETHIRSLIDKYFSGQTSLREEQELSEFFRSGEVPEEFRGIAPSATPALMEGRLRAQSPGEVPLR